MTFAKKVINATITLGSGQFGNQPGSNTVTLTGYRIIANMSAYYGQTQGSLQCKIYGLPLSMMSQLTTIGVINSQIRSQNTISLSVGDKDTELQNIFLGTIDSAWADFQESPNVCLNIISLTPYWMNVTPVPAASFKGPQSADTILNQVVQNINTTCPGQNLSLVNQGVDCTLTDMYLPGTGLTQIKSVANAGKFNFRIDGSGNAGNNTHTLTIWPQNQYTQDAPITLTPNSDPGIIGYPTFSSDGIIVKSLFVNLRQGHKVTIAGSIIEQANADWYAQNVTHQLESERPGGAWTTTFMGTRIIN